jgi:hypothetical protein
MMTDETDAPQILQMLQQIMIRQYRLRQMMHTDKRRTQADTDRS